MQWANVYEADSPSHKLITDIMNSFLLVNVVHNDFKDSNAIFEPFFRIGAEFGLHIDGPNGVNGTNGTH